jgi:hypothetical protein
MQQRKYESIDEPRQYRLRQLKKENKRVLCGVHPRKTLLLHETNQQQFSES